ncbi:DegQ family serine endoprotease [Nitrosomonas communis]|uniref:DegQ family serine endoprotease n=1 Tax=Nitrosomonas communis TaxID=44574 RepID=UPI003D2B40A6
MKKNLIVSLLGVAWLIALPSEAKEDAIANLRQTSKAFASVARAISPSVVFIQVEGKASREATPFFPQFDDEWPFSDDFFKRFFGGKLPGIPSSPYSDQPQEERRIMEQGSGFVFETRSLLSDKTYILTNNHVVENADKIRVEFQDGRQFVAEVTGRDPQSDIAVIEINARGYPALTLADSSKLEVGEWVVAIGNPFGLSHTLTVGVVSAKGRTSLGINDYEDFIQTDAAINPGNSGGPLVNLDGEVVGINTAIFSRSGGYMGVGFAIPSNLAKAITTQLIEHGEVTRGYLGIVIQQLTSDLAESFGIEASQGILVAQVSKHSPAEKAGLQQGDIIERFQGELVKDVGSFRNQVALLAPGTTVELTILRNGKKKNVEVEIGKLTKEKQPTEQTSQRAEDIGLTVQTLTPQLAEQFGATAGEGVIVTEVRPGSVAAMSGIKSGTIILQVNRKAVKNTAEFQRAIKESHSDKRLLLLIREGDTQRFVVLSW